VTNKAEDISKTKGKVVLFADLLGFAALTEHGMAPGASPPPPDQVEGGGKGCSLTT
jgi:hypothetical protein